MLSLDLKGGSMKVSSYLFLFVYLWVSWNANAALLMFQTDSSGFEVDSIRNCSCVLGSPTCTSTQLLASPFCTCTPITATDIADAAESARNNTSVSWWNSDPLTICCEATSSTSASQLLDNLMDFSHTARLTMDHCEGLVSSGDQYYTVYGLQEISIQTDVNANNPIQFLSMTDTDHALTNKRSREYRDYHIAFIDKSLFDGNLEMKSWSAWVYPEEADSNLLQTSLNRAPSSILTKSDGMIMFTPIYD